MRTRKSPAIVRTVLSRPRKLSSDDLYRSAGQLDAISPAKRGQKWERFAGVWNYPKPASNRPGPLKIPPAPAPASHPTLAAHIHATVERAAPH